MKKIGIIFGGRSMEHEISVLSASSVIGAIDRQKYEVVPIAINKNGDWFIILSDMGSILELTDKRFDSLIPSDSKGTETATPINAGEIKNLVDFAFPILHGPYGEDGTIQGLFEMLDIPYAGCGVSSSAIAMDKIFAKELMLRAGIPTCNFCTTFDYIIEKDRDSEFDRFEEHLGYPMIIKPANMGSSVGITKANNREDLSEAIDEALKYDSRLLLECFLDARELEISVTGNNHPTTGAIGEIVSAAEFYDFDSKYASAKTELIIPANIPESLADDISEMALNTYRTLNATGFSRVDFFLEKETNKLFVNEMNTIPGFTAYSMFPLLWAEKGVPYPELIERIIDLGYERYNAKNNR